MLSMAAYFSGVVQAPLTALVIVTEMTGNRSLTLPLMAVVLIGCECSGLSTITVADPRRPLHADQGAVYGRRIGKNNCRTRFPERIHLTQCNLLAVCPVSPVTSH